MSGAIRTSSVQALRELLRRSATPLQLLPQRQRRCRTHIRSFSRAAYQLPNQRRPEETADLAQDQDARAFAGNAPTAPYRPPFRTSAVLDEAIQSYRVTMVETNTEGKNVITRRGAVLREILRTLDREKEHVVQLTPARPDEPASEPICKVATRESLKKVEKDALAREKEQRKKERLLSPKRLEVTWSIGPSDLEHYKRRLEKFLNEGRRVEVVFGVKKKAQPKTPEECYALVREVRRFARDEMKGVTEYANEEGKVGKMFKIFFQGKAPESAEKKK